MNEAKAIGSVIDRIPRQHLERMGYEVDVWVVDGKSRDATLEVASAKGAKAFVQDGQGKGTGMRQAFEHLFTADEEGADNPLPKKDFLLMLDADGTYPPEHIPRIVKALEEGNDFVLGSRFRGQIEEGALPEFNRIGNRMLTAFARTIYRVPVSDVCTGMWGFRGDSLRRLGLTADGFDLEADIFATAAHMGAKLAEVPINYGRRVGKPKMVPLRTGLLIAWRLFMRWLNRPDSRAAKDAKRKGHTRKGKSTPPSGDGA